MLVALVVLSGLIAMGIFRWMHVYVLTDPKYHCPEEAKREKVKGRMSMRENLSYLFKSRYLLGIATIVISYNLVINLVEVLWKHQVKELYSNPNDYNLYMSQITTIIGVIATLTSAFVSGSVIRKFGWTFTAFLTPVILLVTSVCFFSLIFLKGYLVDISFTFMGMTPLVLVVFFGTAQNILSRAAKYTVYDATKEIAFVPLSPEYKVKGKAAIDGICNRLGKSGGSLIHQGLLIAFASLAASAPYVGVSLLAIIAVWVASVGSLGKTFTELSTAEGERVTEGVPSSKEESQEQPALA